jgi:hypothetical protein
MNKIMLIHFYMNKNIFQNNTFQKKKIKNNILM